MGHPVPCIIGGDTLPILDSILDTGTGYLICPQRTKADRPLSNKTIRLKLTALKAFIRFLCQEDFLLSDLTRDISLPKGE